MTSAELENLVRIGRLKREPPVASEIGGLLRSGEARLADAANPSLALESRFDLAYNAAHALGVPWNEVVRQLRARAVTPPILRPAAAADRPRG